MIGTHYQQDVDLDKLFMDVQTTERQALHLAEVIQMALHQNENENGKEYPEQDYLAAHKPGASLSLVEVGLLVGAAALLTAGMIRASRR